MACSQQLESDTAILGLDECVQTSRYALRSPVEQFITNEQPFFGLPLEEQIAAKVKCPLHGDRFAPTFHIYVPKWRRESEKVRWLRLSTQYHKAWEAAFPPNLWPADEEETADGRTVLRLKDGSTLVALESARPRKQP